MYAGNEEAPKRAVAEELIPSENVVRASLRIESAARVVGSSDILGDVVIRDLPVLSALVHVAGYDGLVTADTIVVKGIVVADTREVTPIVTRHEVLSATKVWPEPTFETCSPSDAEMVMVGDGTKENVDESNNEVVIDDPWL